MLNTKSGEDFELSVVHRDWDVNNQFAIGVTKDLPKAFIEVQLLRGEVEARGLRLPGIDLLLERNGRHKISELGHICFVPAEERSHQQANLQILDTA
jgi:hypothetical protein